MQLPSFLLFPLSGLQSEKDKRLDNIKGACHVLRNKCKINDWTGTQSQFMVLQKAMDAAAHVVQEHGVPLAHRLSPPPSPARYKRGALSVPPVSRPRRPSSR